MNWNPYFMVTKVVGAVCGLYFVQYADMKSPAVFVRKYEQLPP
jgi:hypothetical protein